MSASRLACPECRTQFHGSRDACPFCHACIHQVGGHHCRECGIYIPTRAEQRAIERAMREAVIAEDADNIVRTTLMRTIDALPVPIHTHTGV